MKRSSILSNKTVWVFTIACFGLIAMLGACKKDHVVVPVGEIRIQAVNAVESSNSQDFYMNGQKVDSLGAVAYGEYSGYYKATSGNSVIEFADESSNTSNARTPSYDLQIGGYYSFYYAYNPNTNKPDILALQDDMTTESGKAKVRFLHLNSSLNTTGLSINIKDGAALDEADFSAPTKYYSVDAGTKFTVTVAGLPTPLEIDANLMAGKNYTIWLDGASATELNSHVVVQNP